MVDAAHDAAPIVAAVGGRGADDRVHPRPQRPHQRRRCVAGTRSTRRSRCTRRTGCSGTTSSTITAPTSTSWTATRSRSRGQCCGRSTRPGTRPGASASTTATGRCYQATPCSAPVRGRRAVVLGLPDDHRVDPRPAARAASGDGGVARPRRHDDGESAAGGTRPRRLDRPRALTSVRLRPRRPARGTRCGRIVAPGAENCRGGRERHCGTPTTMSRSCCSTRWAIRSCSSGRASTSRRTPSRRPSRRGSRVIGGLHASTRRAPGSGRRPRPARWRRARARRGSPAAAGGRSRFRLVTKRANTRPSRRSNT